MKAYLDYAATTPVRKEVLQVMLPYFTEHFGNPSSIHSWGQTSRQAIDKARIMVSDSLHCEPDEIYFTGTTTTCTNAAILGLIKANPSRKHLITTPVEHHAVLNVFEHLQKKENYTVSLMKVDQYGMIDPDELDSLIKPETLLVSVMYANNEVGTLQPIAKLTHELGKINEKRKQQELPAIYLHIDAAAVAEYIKINLKEIPVDLLSLGAHKFHGPKGTGILFLRKGIPMAPLFYGGHQEHGLWPGTENVAGIVGTALALKLAQLEINQAKNVEKLRNKLIEELLKRIPKAQLTGHQTQRLADIASFTFEGAEGEANLLLLDRAGIAASSGSACTSGDLRPSHVLLAMGIPEKIAHSSIRFSLGKETTEAEIDYVISILPPIIEKLRSMSPYGDNVSEKVV